jgi:hypothetical protein
MEFKGTKGKWVFNANDSSENRCFVNNEQIDVWHWGNIEEGKANALLISKAPEMLEMLENLLNIIDWSYENWQNDKGIFYKQQLEQLIKEATELK